MFRACCFAFLKNKTFCFTGVRLVRKMHKTSLSHGDFKKLRKAFFPSFNNLNHKGQWGRLLVIGGSIDYTGAPYFAAISALRLGADLVHVFCPRVASPVIKSFSPELIVHPLLDDSEKYEEMEGWLNRMHAVVVGPGLGDDEAILNTVQKLITKIRLINLPLIIDADGLRLVYRQPSLIGHYTNTTITPNAPEFERLAKALKIERTGNEVEETERAAVVLGNVTIIRKGPHDIVSNGKTSILVNEEGSMRRCGGQGDILAGFNAVLSHWSSLVKVLPEQDASTHKLIEEHGLKMCAAVVSCLLVRDCSRITFETMGRSMVASDMITNIPKLTSSYE